MCVDTEVHSELCPLLFGLGQGEALAHRCAVTLLAAVALMTLVTLVTLLTALSFEGLQRRGLVIPSDRLNAARDDVCTAAGCSMGKVEIATVILLDEGDVAGHKAWRQCAAFEAPARRGRSETHDQTR